MVSMLAGAKVKRLLVGAVLAGGLTAFGIASAYPAGAQVPPTVPCPQCGPGAPGPGTGAYAYTEFTCVAPPRFLLFAGVNANTTEPVAYTVTYGDVDAAGQPAGPVTTVSLDTLRPGQYVPSAALTWAIPHAPGVAQRVQISGVGATTGRRYVNFNKVIACTCPGSTTTTTAATTTTTTTATTGTVASRAVSTPATAVATGQLVSTSSTASASSAQGQSSGAASSAVTLPATGSTMAAPLVAWGFVLVALGLVVIVVLARPAAEEE
jgi:LPXTG-motif cell wall-anchored protein